MIKKEQNEFWGQLAIFNKGDNGNYKIISVVIK